jgi:hypothetical protein
VLLASPSAAKSASWLSQQLRSLLTPGLTYANFRLRFAKAENNSPSPPAGGLGRRQSESFNNPPLPLAGR